ncbi:MAG: CRISPR-associated endonuclease Cas2 [Candidatus Hydrothermae bacterium]|nr:CRISPR-associated endonuclease Cas2 [Candidatus Hydrothermae bacterium]
MFVILVYDVEVKRVSRVLKIARKYLTWVQNSVLEGELTRAQFVRLKEELEREIEEEKDSVIFYILRHEGLVQREQLGYEKSPGDIL